MASTTTQAPSEEQLRRRPLQTYNSFPRPDPAVSVSELRKRASSTIENTTPNARPQLKPVNTDTSSLTRSAFDSTADGSGDSKIKEEDEEPKTPADFDQLPLELVSLCDTFIDSLSAKVHSTPPTVDRLASLFQNFYILAAQHINTHISLLSSRQNRLGSTSSSCTSLSSRRSKGRLSVGSKDKPKSALERSEAEQQLLTAEELVQRKKARKALEKKRLGLEEAVERQVIEKIYGSIWRHRSTQDEEQDEKLRSKTAALAVVGIGLSDLGVDLGEGTDADRNAEKEKEVKNWLTGARKELHKMNDEKSPLGKLQKLKAAHKCIVETLSHFHPSSSADEIMPMLIYTLITSPPEGIDVISNLYFIQRFRSESKIDGEAAYCLTNLEAAITFLETVDLSSLRADEHQSGPAKLDGANSGLSTPKQAESLSSTTSFPSLAAATPAQGISAPTLSPALIIPPPPETRAVSSLNPPMPARPSRRLSELLHPAQALASGGKDAVLNTAEGGLKTIGNSLGQSYDFLIGKLKERQESLHDVLLPKTLEDARKLVGTDEDDGSASAGSSLHTTDKPKDDKLISMISGRPARDRSVDSAVSGSSGGKKVGFFESRERPSGVSPVGGNPATQVAEGIRMLSSTFNPLNKFAQMRAGFGRSAPPAEAKRESPKIDAVDSVDGEVAELTKAFPELAKILPEEKEEGKHWVKKETKKVDPPIQRFMDVRSPGDLRLSEVVELLRDYRRLAGELKELGAI